MAWHDRRQSRCVRAYGRCAGSSGGGRQSPRRRAGRSGGRTDSTFPAPTRRDTDEASTSGIHAAFVGTRTNARSQMLAMPCNFVETQIQTSLHHHPPATPAVGMAANTNKTLGGRVTLTELAEARDGTSARDVFCFCFCFCKSSRMFCQWRHFSPRTYGTPAGQGGEPNAIAILAGSDGEG